MERSSTLPEILPTAIMANMVPTPRGANRNPMSITR